jgi:DnaK suppressor protein
MKETKALRQQLTTRYAELSERLARVSNDERRTSEPLDADFAEQAVERENDEVLTALDGSIRAEMVQLDKTLARLDSGDYGVCESCGKAIALKRLAALPHATRCVACEAHNATS